MLPLEHFIKGYGTYIDFNNFSFKVGEAQFIAFSGQFNKIRYS